LEKGEPFKIIGYFFIKKKESDFIVNKCLLPNLDLKIMFRPMILQRSFIELIEEKTLNYDAVIHKYQDLFKLLCDSKYSPSQKEAI